MSTPELKNVVLIGYRGAGKSAVGRLLADQMRWTFVDTDALIESEAGRSIAQIFAALGEPAFRKHERDVIARVTQRQHQVIAVGGGAILDRRNIDRLRADGWVIWLTAPPEVLWNRIQSDTATPRSRPNLTETGGLDEVRQVLTARQSAYDDAAHQSFPTEHQTPQQAAQAIKQLLKNLVPS